MRLAYCVIICTFLYFFDVNINAEDSTSRCTKQGGECHAPPDCSQIINDCEEELSVWYEECMMLEDMSLCPDEEVCCTGYINATLNHDILASENRERTSSSRAFGKKCRNAGGECKSSCLYGSQSPDDCFLRKCCKKPACSKGFLKCVGGDCFQSTCPANRYDNYGGCTTNHGATCRCCKPCKRKFLQCSGGGRCTTESCLQHEVLFNSKCTSSQCHCCQPCRRKFLQCLGGRCTKGSCLDSEVKYLGKCTHEQCHCCGPCKKKLLQCIGGRCTKEACSDTEVEYRGKCTHDDCRCCGPCKKKLSQCVQGRCTKEPCHSNELTLLGKCQTGDCHCCQAICPDIDCLAAGGRCRENCKGFWVELGNGTCDNNCKCCKFDIPFLSSSKSDAKISADSIKKQNEDSE